MTWHTTLDETDQYEICELYAEGSGIVELARQFRTRTALINSVLAENGVQRKTKTASTPIECRLHDALRAAGIGFSTQKRLADRYIVDIVLHQAPVIIEADGELHRWKPEAQERDAVRDVVHELAGYQVFRFTGSEINTDAVACVQKVIDACGLTADENPVYDIRTKFSGADHPRYVGEYELTCEYCGEGFLNRRSKRKYCSHEHYILSVQKGRPKSAEWRARIGEGNRGRVQSAETRAKISAARAGTPSPNKGKTMSAEQRAKISASLKGRKESAETREKKSAARLGKTQSPETRAKISAALSGRPKNQIMIESDLTRERESSAETTLPATLF